MQSYTRTAIALHWLMAALMTAGFTLGATMVDLHISPRKVRLYACLLYTSTSTVRERRKEPR